MGIEEFCEEVINELQELVSTDTDIQMQKVYKNNGLCLDGIVIRYVNEICTPQIYVNDYFQSYQNGKKSITQIAKEVLKLRKSMEREKIDPITDLRWENIKDKVFCRLVNLQMNQKKIEHIPHRTYLDFAITCRLLHLVDYNGMASSEIGYGELELMGVTEEELFNQALLNTERLFPVEFRPMVSVLEKILKNQNAPDSLIKESLDLEEMQEKVNMYVLSNTTGVNGAMTILYEDILKQIAIQLKTEILYLLPSSVHEWIVLPGCDDVAFLKDLVENVNYTEVPDMDVLSYHVYRYDSSTDMVEIAA